jgi:hypothetical protein
MTNVNEIEMEMSNPNELWTHAQSAEKSVQKKARLAELEYMRDLFGDRLPVGDELSEINSYFDHLEQVIENNGSIQDEQFESEQPIIDPETNTEASYRYYSAPLSHQRATSGRPGIKHSDEGLLEYQPSTQDVDSPSSSRRRDGLQDQLKESIDFSHMAKREEGFDSPDQKHR